MTVKLSKPKLRIVLGDPTNEESWLEIEVQTINYDQILAERELIRAKLGKLDEAPLSWLAATAYYALKRTGQLTDPKVTFSDFELACLEIESIGDEPANPTLPAPATG